MTVLEEERSGAGWLYSHSVVPGGLDVRSNITREIPGIFLISFTIFSTTYGPRELQRRDKRMAEGRKT